MNEMYEIAQQAKYRFWEVSEMYKICHFIHPYMNSLPEADSALRNKS